MPDKNQLRQAAVKSLYRSVKVANHDVAKTRLIKIASGIAAGKTISEAVTNAGITGDTATVLTARIAKMAMRDAVSNEKKAGPFRRIANNIRNRRAARRAPAAAAAPAAVAPAAAAPAAVAPAAAVSPAAAAAPAAVAPAAAAPAAVAPAAVAKSVPTTSPTAKSVTPVVPTVSTEWFDKKVRQQQLSPTDKAVTPTGNSYDAAFDAAFNTGRESGPTQVASSPLVELGSQARQAVSSGASNMANMPAKLLQQASPQRPPSRIINQTPTRLPQPIQQAMDFASALPTELRQAYDNLIPRIPSRLPTPEQVRYGRIGRYSTPAGTPAPAPAPVAPPTQVGNGRTTMTR